ncbi:efflux transporter outer membrane subunit [Bordetella petrii]|uniref:Efflux transporter outer membrane subunit n=1 Tax=Bordetella petrii TaxID=94624 RepID=A0ABT7VWW8_9BORD|nr:efflux transporter outer membrane subunit [Bordetella petrii]MDM9557434.1 efflux transporter outer membrane subunit [Bordetella petrii]
MPNRHSSSRGYRARAASPALALLLMLGGCAVGPDFARPPAPDAGHYGAAPAPAETAGDAGAPPQRLHAGMDIPAQWWRLFRSPELDRLVREALAHSPTIDQARARLREAQQILAAETGGRTLPSVDANLSAGRQKVDPSAYGVPVADQPAPFTLYNASIDVSYTLDVFGAERRALEGLRAQVDLQARELQAARMTLAGNVVTAAIRQAALQARLEAAEALLEAQARQLDIMRQRQRAGGIATLDLHNQESLLAQTRATLPDLRRQRDRARHQLAIYLGRLPAQADLALPAWAALQLPLDVPLGVPSQLTRQRPDILAAEALWHRAAADVGVATANRYPRFTLTGSFGSQRTRAGDVADGVNVWSLALGLTQPLFRGGELRARQRAAEAAYDAAAAAYRQTVLQGFQQVADALRAVQADAAALQGRAEAERQAQAAYAIAARQYQAGGISQFALLDAQREQLRTRAERIQAQADRYADTAALLQALGGGWWNEAPEGVSSSRSPSPSSACHGCLPATASPAD